MLFADNNMSVSLVCIQMRVRCCICARLTTYILFRRRTALGIYTDKIMYICVCSYVV